MLDARIAQRSAAADLILPLFPFALLTLWDMYTGGVRPFDLLAFSFLLLAAGLQPGLSINPDRLIPFLIAALFIVAASVRGFLTDPEAIKPVLGVTMGIMLALVVSAANWRADQLTRGIAWLVVIHAAALFIQLATYLATGRILNFHAWIGATPRLEGVFFRPAGLFQEPAHFSLMMFSLMTLYRLLDGRSVRVQLLALLSLLTSASLWGIAAAFVYLVLFFPRAAILSAVAALSAGLAGLSVAGTDSIIVKWSLHRLENLGSDNSAQARYGGLLSGGGDAQQFWFGSGISNEYLSTGSSSASFLVNACGIVGLTAFALFWITIAPEQRRWRGLAALVLMMTAATQWTAAWWWVWIALAASVPVDRGQA